MACIYKIARSVLLPLVPGGLPPPTPNLSIDTEKARCLHPA